MVSEVNDIKLHPHQRFKDNSHADGNKKAKQMGFYFLLSHKKFTLKEYFS
jgi:hypothetical protein